MSIKDGLPALSPDAWDLFKTTRPFTAWLDNQRAASKLDIADMAKRVCVGATRVAGCSFTLSSRNFASMQEIDINDHLKAEDDKFMEEVDDVPIECDDGEPKPADPSTFAKKLQMLLKGGFGGNEARKAVLGPLPPIHDMLELPPNACVPEGVALPGLGAVPTAAMLQGKLQSAGWTETSVA